MAKKKKSKTHQPAPAAKPPATAESAVTASPYLLVAHPPARNPTLLAVSVILFAAWFLFLVLAALSG